MKYIIKLSKCNEGESYFGGRILTIKVSNIQFATAVPFDKAKRYSTKRKAQRVLNKIKNCINGHLAQIERS